MISVIKRSVLAQHVRRRHTPVHTRADWRRKQPDFGRFGLRRQKELPRLPVPTFGKEKGKLFFVSASVSSTMRWSKAVTEATSPGGDIEPDVLAVSKHCKSKSTTAMVFPKMFVLVYFAPIIYRDEEVQKYGEKHGLKPASPRAAAAIATQHPNLCAELGMKSYGIVSPQVIQKGDKRWLVGAWRLKTGVREVYIREAGFNWPESWFIFEV